MKKYLNIVIDCNTKTTVAEYHGVQVSEPTIIVLDDGSGAVKITSYNSFWIPKDVMDKLLSLQTAQEVENMRQKTLAEKPAVSQTVIDSNTLLKALAIAQDSKLAIQLIKD